MPTKDIKCSWNTNNNIYKNKPSKDAEYKKIEGLMQINKRVWNTRN